MNSGFFLILLLTIGTFLTPINIQNSYGNSILLYTVHQVAGSGDVNTDTLRKEKCFVHVQIDVYSAHYGAFHRNNPDKTFYPGDAFDYATTTWKDGCGSFWQPCPIQSTPNNTVPNGPDCIKGVTYYKNRVNIPSEFLDELQWAKGDELQISIRNHKLIIEKV